MKMTKALIVCATLMAGGVQAGDAFYDIEVTGLSGLTMAPGKTVWQPEPVYPKMALRRGLAGEVLVSYDVNAQGKAENIRILESSPRGFFDNATVRLLENTTFSRGYDNGEAATVTGFTRRFIYDIVREDRREIQLALTSQ